jgi:hypothetical protein
MKRTIYFPIDLAQQIEQYLQEHPNETWSGLVQKSVQRALQPKDPTKLLDLIGVIENAPTDLSVSQTYTYGISCSFQASQ